METDQTILNKINKFQAKIDKINKKLEEHDRKIYLLNETIDGLKQRVRNLR